MYEAALKSTEGLLYRSGVLFGNPCMLWFDVRVRGLLKAMGAAATLVGRNDLRGFPVGMSGRPGVGLDSITIRDVAPFAFVCAHVLTEELVWLR